MKAPSWLGTDMQKTLNFTCILFFSVFLLFLAFHHIIMYKDVVTDIIVQILAILAYLGFLCFLVFSLEYYRYSEKNNKPETKDKNKESNPIEEVFFK